MNCAKLGIVKVTISSGWVLHHEAPGWPVRAGSLRRLTDRRSLYACLVALLRTQGRKKGRAWRRCFLQDQKVLVSLEVPIDPVSLGSGSAT